MSGVPRLLPRTTEKVWFPAQQDAFEEEWLTTKEEELAAANAGLADLLNFPTPFGVEANKEHSDTVEVGDDHDGDEEYDVDEVEEDEEGDDDEYMEGDDEIDVADSSIIAVQEELAHQLSTSELDMSMD